MTCTATGKRKVLDRVCVIHCSMKVTHADLQKQSAISIKDCSAIKMCAHLLNQKEQAAYLVVHLARKGFIAFLLEDCPLQTWQNSIGRLARANQVREKMVCVAYGCRWDVQRVISAQP